MGAIRTVHRSCPDMHRDRIGTTLKGASEDEIANVAIAGRVGNHHHEVFWFNCGLA